MASSGTVVERLDIVVEAEGGEVVAEDICIRCREPRNGGDFFGSGATMRAFRRGLEVEGDGSGLYRRELVRAGVMGRVVDGAVCMCFGLGRGMPLPASSREAAALMGLDGDCKPGEDKPPSEAELNLLVLNGIRDRPGISGGDSGLLGMLPFNTARSIRGSFIAGGDPFFSTMFDSTVMSLCARRCAGRGRGEPSRSTRDPWAGGVPVRSPPFEYMGETSDTSACDLVRRCASDGRWGCSEKLRGSCEMPNPASRWSGMALSTSPNSGRRAASF